MGINQTSSDTFSYDYQQMFIRYYILGMPEEKLRRLASHYLGHSRTELADRTADLIAGDEGEFYNFFLLFPLSQQECVKITKGMLYGSCINQWSKTKLKHSSFVVKPKSKK